MNKLLKFQQYWLACISYLVYAIISLDISLLILDIKFIMINSNSRPNNLGMVYLIN